MKKFNSYIAMLTSIAILSVSTFSFSVSAIEEKYTGSMGYPNPITDWRDMVEYQLRTFEDGDIPSGHYDNNNLSFESDLLVGITLDWRLILINDNQTETTLKEYFVEKYLTEEEKLIFDVDYSCMYIETGYELYFKGLFTKERLLELAELDMITGMYIGFGVLPNDESTTTPITTTTVTQIDKYTVEDLITLAKRISGKLTASSIADNAELNAVNFDVNQDGKIDGEDLLYMIKIMTGEIQVN